MKSKTIISKYLDINSIHVFYNSRNMINETLTLTFSIPFPYISLCKSGMKIWSVAYVYIEEKETPRP
jgi:hypothetical protein